MRVFEEGNCEQGNTGGQHDSGEPEGRLRLAAFVLDIGVDQEETHEHHDIQTSLGEEAPESVDQDGDEAQAPAERAVGIILERDPGRRPVQSVEGSAQIQNRFVAVERSQRGYSHERPDGELPVGFVIGAEIEPYLFRGAEGDLEGGGLLAHVDHPELHLSQGGEPRQGFLHQLHARAVLEGRLFHDPGQARLRGRNQP